MAREGDVSFCSCDISDPQTRELVERVEAGEDQRVVSLDIWDPAHLWAITQPDLIGTTTVTVWREPDNTPPIRSAVDSPRPAKSYRVHSLLHNHTCIGCGRPAHTIGCKTMEAAA